MSVAPPARIWWKPLGRTERLWVTLSVLWAIVLFFMMIVWGAIGKQDTPVETYRTTPEQFGTVTADFVKKYQVGTDKGVPVVRPPAGGDAYLRASRWAWYPILELKKGETYRIHLSSIDIQHGFSLPQEVFSLNYQVLPGYIYVVTITPPETGEFPVVCNEYCGMASEKIGHHSMVGKIVVKE